MTTDELRALLTTCRRYVTLDDQGEIREGHYENELIKRLDAALSSDFAVVPLDALNKAYLLGFNTSGEGYNGEFPFGDKGKSPEGSVSWSAKRDQQIANMITAAEKK